MCKMLGFGLKIYLNIDDLMLYKVNLGEVWELMFSYFGFIVVDLKQFMLNGIDGVWVDDVMKVVWCVVWVLEFDVFVVMFVVG